VFCDERGFAYKVGRRREDHYRQLLGEEAEWLAVANHVPWVKDRVVKLYAWNPLWIVITRECIAGRQAAGRVPHALWETHKEITRLMIPHGWSAPEFKNDSYVYDRGRGWVLVDAGFVHRMGRGVVRYVVDILSGKRSAYGMFETPHYFASVVEREMYFGRIPERIGERLIARLQALGAWRREEPK
jgi:hypothetical protein